MSTVYAIIKYTLDDFSGLDTKWVADMDTLRAFSCREVRDEVLSGLEDACECYEQWLPVDIPVITRAMYEETIIHHRKI